MCLIGMFYYCAFQWDLVCRSEWKVAFGQSMFMTGYFVGAVTLGNIADL